MSLRFRVRPTLSSKWGWTEEGRSMMLFTTKASTEMHREVSTVRTVHQSCLKLWQWVWDIVLLPYQLVTGCRLPLAGDVTLAEGACSLSDRGLHGWPQLRAVRWSMIRQLASGSWLGDMERAGLCSHPPLVLAVPGCLVGLHDTGVNICRGFDGWWEMERHQPMHPLLSFLLPGSAKWFRRSSRERCMGCR